jgi:hypothetical protein
MVTLASSIAVDPATSVPDAQYASTLEEAAIFKALNDMRGAMGVGLLLHNEVIVLLNPFGFSGMPGLISSEMGLFSFAA